MQGHTKSCLLDAYLYMRPPSTAELLINWGKFVKNAVILCQS